MNSSRNYIDLTMQSARHNMFVTIMMLIFLLLAACSSPSVPPVESEDATQTSESPDTTSESGEEIPATQDIEESQLKEIVIASTQELQGVDPVVSIFLNDVNLLYVNLYDALVERNAEGGLDPSLAESWEIESPTEWVFHLREGVQFHNGEPFTAEDVVFVINRAIEREDTHAEVRGQLEGATAIDDYTVKITTSQPDPLFLERMYLTRMLPKDYIEERGDDNWQSAPIGTGPFKWVEWVRGSHYILEKNTDYWRGQPNLDSITVRLIPENATRISALRAGEVDLIMQLPPDQAATIDEESDIRVEAAENVRVVFLEFFPESPTGDGSPLEDVRVRQALNYAIDVQTIIDTVMGGYATRVATLVPIQTFGYDESIEPYPYDPDMARRLLAEAGYPDGFTISVDAPTGGNVIKPVELNEAIVAFWNEVGVTANLRTLEFGAYADLKVNYEIAPIFVWNWFGFDADQMLWGNAHSDSPWFYYPGWDERIDELIDAERSTLDVDERMEAFSELQRRLKDDAGYIPLYQQMDVYGVNERLIWQANVGGPVFLWEADVQN